MVVWLGLVLTYHLVGGFRVSLSNGEIRVQIFKPILGEQD